MKDKQIVLGLVGSPNKEGRTAEVVSAALTGAAGAGAVTELVQISDYVVEACRDCLPDICAENQKCTYKDENFELLSRKILDYGALVIGTPVYWGDTSAMVKSLLMKMTRVYARSGRLKGKPALGIAMAGGSGKGLLTGLRPLYHFFRTTGMRALEPLPSTRFNLDKAKKAAEIQGQRLAEMALTSVPFGCPEELDDWYDNMYFINDDRAEERRVMAAITYDAIPVERKQEVDGKLVQTSILSVVGRSSDAVEEIKKVYNSCLKIIDEK